VLDTAVIGPLPLSEPKWSGTMNLKSSLSAEGEIFTNGTFKMRKAQWSILAVLLLTSRRD
jgi:hypothetical protein